MNVAPWLYPCIKTWGARVPQVNLYFSMMLFPTNPNHWHLATLPDKFWCSNLFNAYKCPPDVFLLKCARCALANQLPVLAICVCWEHRTVAIDTYHFIRAIWFFAFVEGCSRTQNNVHPLSIHQNDNLNRRKVIFSDDIMNIMYMCFIQANSLRCVLLTLFEMVPNLQITTVAKNHAVHAAHTGCTYILSWAGNHSCS